MLAAGSKQGTQVDMWSAGCILYCLLTGAMPFDEEDQGALFKKIMGGEYSMAPKLWAGVTTQAQDLVKQLLQACVALPAQALQHSIHRVRSGHESPRCS